MLFNCNAFENALLNRILCVKPLPPGSVHAPLDDIFLVPQRVYSSSGSLADQVRVITGHAYFTYMFTVVLFSPSLYYSSFSLYYSSPSLYYSSPPLYYSSSSPYFTRIPGVLYVSALIPQTQTAHWKRYYFTGARWPHPNAQSSYAILVTRRTV